MTPEADGAGADATRPARRRGPRRATRGATGGAGDLTDPADPAEPADPTGDDTDAGWGERVDDAAHRRWLTEQRPPHWG